MSARLPLFLSLVLISPASFAAQEPAPSTEKRDYSRAALLRFVFETGLADDGEEGFAIDRGIVYRHRDWVFRWSPIGAPLMLSQGMGERASLMPPVDPFVLTGTSIPYTKASFRDRWSERRIRRFLQKNVEAAR